MIVKKSPAAESECRGPPCRIQN